MPQYVLLLHDCAAHLGDVSAEEMQQIIGRYRKWSMDMAAKGHLRGGHKLQDGTGRVMRGGGGKVEVTDGPYAETKEVIGGYFLLEAANYDEAVEISRDCPHLDYGTVVIREIEPTE